MLDLPPAIAAYFTLAPDADTTALGAIFAADARVHDEARDHAGLEEIRAWRIDAHTKTPFVARPLAVQERGGTLVVSVEVSGSFPNSPLMLDHTFAMADGRIASLDIR